MKDKTEKIRLRKDTSVQLVADRLRIPYACVAAMPLPKSEGEGYVLIDEFKREEVFEKMDTGHNRRLFNANLAPNIPKGEYSVERLNNVYRLKKVL